MEQRRDVEPGTPIVDKKYCVVVTKDGPYCVYGNPPLNQEIIVVNEKDEAWDYKKGRSFVMTEEPTHLCRCGHSKTKPYCDGTHLNIEWSPELTASKQPLLDGAEIFDGPRYQLIDNPEFCVHARICMAEGTAWRAVKRSNLREKEEILKHEVFRCPSGRLKLLDKETGQFIEPDLQPSLALIEDPQKACSGPLWVRGGIPIEDCSGNKYEVRNRVALCRCGKSKNKPFCDGVHMDIGFKDEL
ncbi:CDGSH iron-sulfur domain-containing protein [Odoribacter sp. OttesenSCG-928-J03]|nr:CDGSH iron-sulfur domain-containing protein [Odoribacter sp. OttesenSCG-928-J03]MDL2283219.1 CDGSH iron-sulfur domain-containing protein [Odoribacter sp. OttesenSCG-928-G04]